MKLKEWARAILIVTSMSSLNSATANSVGFDSNVYAQESGQVSINLVYNFLEYPIFGGSVDIVYDASFIELISYTQGPLASDVHPAVSPVGSLIQPGYYSGVGIGYLGPFGGITSAGPIGTFVFSVIGTPTHSTPCGAALCINGNALNPFISITGEDVTETLLENGFNSAEIVVPLPSSIWFLLSGMSLLAGFRRKSS